MKKEHIEKQDLGWIEWESSSELFSLAKKRIYKPNGDLELEIPPKWEVFSTLIEEIRHCKQRGTRANRSILINCKNYASAKLGFQFYFVLILGSPVWGERRFLFQDCSYKLYILYSK